jgi:hypothetical protein
LQELAIVTNVISDKFTNTTCSKIFCNWLAKILTAKCRPIVIAPAKTGKNNNNKNAVIKTDPNKVYMKKNREL